MPYYTKSTERLLKPLLQRIENAVYKTVSSLEAAAWITSEPVSFENRFSGEKKSIQIGEQWGNLWDCAWFHFTGKVPEEAAGKKVVLLIDVSGEACIVDEKGSPLQGLTNVHSEFDYSLGLPGKRVVPFLEKAEGGENIDIWADAGCNDLFGKYKDNGTLREAYVAICNENMRGLYYDFEVLHELMRNLPEDTARRYSIMYALTEVGKMLHSYSEEEAKAAREILADELNKKGGDPSLIISAVGHAHIDLAWLWPVRETIRKGARTFSTALAMMDKYPDYVFGASQPQLYQWMKDYYPGLYERVKAKIAEGRWEAQGAMWVEADTNVSGGEALVRQVLYGKRFFRDEFDKDMKILWLPDVFGYTAALPQILKKSGVDYFATIKLSWSQHNQHPHHTFVWKGLDGSSVLTHMPPEGTYNSSAAPRAVAKSEKQYLDKGISDRCLLMFGIGDGGGGPGAEHLERLDREKNLNGLAPVVQEPALDFFKHLEKRKDAYKEWSGELYLERHQGTYTTQARNKKYNRKLELALRELEYASMQAYQYCGTSYPKDELDSIWKEMLLYQFHDILPGSSITRVYSESLERYEKLMNQTLQLTQKAYDALVDKINTDSFREPVVLMNSLPWDRVEWISLKDKWIKANVPAMGYTTIEADTDGAISHEIRTGDSYIENDKLRVSFQPDGSISSVFDKENQREVIAEGMMGNRLAVYDDPGDAWDFPIQYDEIPSDQFVLTSTESMVDGPKGIVKHEYCYGRSKLSQKVIVTAGSRRIDFVTEVDWNESHKMLRTSFPVNVYTNEVSCDIQFGNIKRPAHRNTSWDMAKYEICAHKWIDLSQGDYGVSLMNDCKYGHKVLGNVMDLNLLRSSGYPDSQADRAYHEFTYSLYPHGGSLAESDVVETGYELNIPLTAVPVKAKGQGSLPFSASFLNVDAYNVVIETVKKAEDSDDIIIRLYECRGAGVTTKMNFNFPPKTVELVNMMEESIREINIDSHSIELTFKPFEIHTIKVSN